MHYAHTLCGDDWRAERQGDREVQAQADRRLEERAVHERRRMVQARQPGAEVGAGADSQHLAVGLGTSDLMPLWEAAATSATPRRPADDDLMSVHPSTLRLHRWRPRRESSALDLERDTQGSAALDPEMAAGRQYSR